MHYRKAHFLCSLVPTLRLRVDFSLGLWWCATTFCWKRQVGNGMKKVGNHCPRHHRKSTQYHQN